MPKLNYNRKPETPAELFRFAENSAPARMRALENEVATLRQLMALAADALTEYEEVLRFVARPGGGARTEGARDVLKKFENRVKSHFPHDKES